MSETEWVRLECLVDDGDRGSDRLWELGAAGVEVQDRETFMEGGAIAPVPEGKTRLIAFFSHHEEPLDELSSRIALELGIARSALTLLPFEDESWKTAWKAYFKPVLLSPRFMVGPPWETFDAPKGGYRIVIEPGMAFGTGTHETTQLVATHLDGLLRESSPGRLLDVGCGSAILSMLAATLGVNRVIGIDIDPDAIDVARRTVEANNLGSSIELSTRSVDAFDESFPVVVANILATILLRIRESLVECTEPGGLLVVSGVTREQADAFAEKFEGAELSEIEREVRGDWISFVYRRES